MTAQRRVRLALDAAIVAFGFIWVSWISPDDTWKGGVCIEIGFAFAAMELVVYLFESGRCGSQGWAATRSSPSTGCWRGCTTRSPST